MRTFLLVDASASMGYRRARRLQAGRTRATWRRRSAYLLAQQGDPAGLLLFDEQTRQYLPPAHARRPHPRPADCAGGRVSPAGRHASRGARWRRSARSADAAEPDRRCSRTCCDAPADLADRLRQLRARGTTWWCSTCWIPTRSSCRSTTSPSSRAWSRRTRGGCWPIRAIWRRRSARVGARCGSAGGDACLEARVEYRFATTRSRPPRCCAPSCSTGSGRGGDGMNFLAPALLLGLVAAALPWLIHLIGRRRARPVRFAAMELLLRAEREVSARRRLRDILLLIARTGLAAALPLVFARPFAEVRSDLPAVTDAVAERGDRARRFGQHAAGAAPAATPCSSWPRARAQAARRAHVARLGRGAGAGVRRRRPRRWPSCRPTRARAGGAGGARGRSARRADFAAALRRAAQILTSSPRAERRIYVDHRPAGGGLGGRRAGATRAGRPRDRARSTSRRRALGQPRGDRAAPSPRPRRARRGWRSSPRSPTTRPSRLRTLGVTLRIDGAEVARGFVDIPAAGRARKRFLHTLSGGGAAHQVEVEIDARASRSTTGALARVEVSRGLRVLVVNGDPRTVRNEDEAFFLEAALRAGGVRLRGHDRDARRRSAAASWTATPPSSWPTWPSPAPKLAAALVRYVEAGGGLFISVGDRVDVDAWNERAGRILPQPLGSAAHRRRAAGRTAEGETVDTRPAERLAPIDRRHPLLAGFPGRGRGAGLGALLPVHAAGADARQRPAERWCCATRAARPPWSKPRRGRGRVLLLTTTVDREWTDLPIRPGFLPLVQEAARYLAGRASGEAAAALVVGRQARDRAGRRGPARRDHKPGGESRWLTPAAHAGDARARHNVAVHRDRRAGPVPRARRARRRHGQRAPGRGVRRHAGRERIGSGAAARRQAPRPCRGRRGGGPRAAPAARAVARAGRGGDRARAASSRC